MLRYLWRVRCQKRLLVIEKQEVRHNYRVKAQAVWKSCRISF